MHEVLYQRNCVRYALNVSFCSVSKHLNGEEKSTHTQTHTHTHNTEHTNK